jgi:prevent-host-death family protein
MPEVTVAEARKSIAAILNRASYGHERTIITRHSQAVAAIISIDELRLLDALIERYEDEVDIADAAEALSEAREDSVAWQTVKDEFGL